MIEKIGVIYQDAISLGFLRGLRDRLQCSAEIVLPATAIGKTRQMPRKAAKSAWEYFRRNGVHLIVRFTDADRNPWRDVHKRALGVVPSEARGLWICGVGVDNPEEWMCRDACCLAGVLSVPIDELLNPANRVGRVKHALGQVKRPDEKLSDAVARIVRDAPTEVFRRWLEDPALRTFYTDCRAAATAADCDTPNELEQSQSQDE